MKRTLTFLALTSLFMTYFPAAFGQDDEGDGPVKAKTAIKERPEDDDGSDASDIVRKKKQPVHKVHFGLEAGLSSCYLWRPDATNDPVIGSRLGGILYVPLVG